MLWQTNTVSTQNVFVFLPSPPLGTSKVKQLLTGWRFCYVLKEKKTALNKVYSLASWDKNASEILLIHLIGIGLL